MSTPGYSGTAVTVRVADGPTPVIGIWRNACPVDCGWHGSDWEGRGLAAGQLDGEAPGHRCLRTAPEASTP